MEILAHRGYWNDKIQNNSEQALTKALSEGFGFESDIRDYKGKLVISHNIADERSLDANSVFERLAGYNNKYCFAINIKADGLKDLLLSSLRKYDITNYFAFDMTVPQMIEYAETGIKFYTRQSEYEKEPVLYSKASGVWIDAFENDDWITQTLIDSHIFKGKRVCIVSPDLHKREYKFFWNKLLTFDLDFSKIALCTDNPSEAKITFADK